jgi:hypothetical protein
MCNDFEGKSEHVKVSCRMSLDSSFDDQACWHQRDADVAVRAACHKGRAAIAVTRTSSFRRRFSHVRFFHPIND